MSDRIGLYGGSFDPVHFGHLISARAIGEQLQFTRVILIPSPRPPHKPDVQLTDPRHRLAMARLAVQGDPFFEVSDIELDRAGPSYTIDTVQEFRRRLGSEIELFWIIGADSLPELPTWRRIAELVTLVKIVTAARPGWRPPDRSLLADAVGVAAAQALLDQSCITPEIQISATEIRQRVAAGKSARYLLPDAVASYISSEGLYRLSV